MWVFASDTANIKGKPDLHYFDSLFILNHNGILQHTIEARLPNKDVKTLCIKYAELEWNLGELFWPWAIFVYVPESADPRQI